MRVSVAPNPITLAGLAVAAAPLLFPVTLADVVLPAAATLGMPSLFINAAIVLLGVAIALAGVAMAGIQVRRSKRRFERRLEELAGDDRRPGPDTS